MSPVKTALVYLSGNKFLQRLLERAVLVAQYLMGIGSGSGVESSGENAALRLLRRRWLGPYCIFDVGANQGQYLHSLASCFPPNDISVHCFEPSAETFRILASNVAQNYQNKVKLNNLALGKKPGELSLFYDAPGSGLASLTKRRLDHFGIKNDRSEVVRVDTLDNYCKEHAIEHIHLLKLDVEGHELDVLAGASEMLAKRAIDMVVFEFGGCNIDTRTFVQDFFYFFQAQNMSLFRIAPSGYLFPMTFYQETYEQFRATNFAAVRNG